jgi:hypothetical protein
MSDIYNRWMHADWTCQLLAVNVKQNIEIFHMELSYSVHLTCHPNCYTITVQTDVLTSTDMSNT